jgi:hypothetical protein
MINNCMIQDPTLIQKAMGAPEEDSCVVCGHACHHGEVCTVRDCHCGVCYHHVDQVDDYIKIDEES